MLGSPPPPPIPGIPPPSRKSGLNDWPRGSLPAPAPGSSNNMYWEWRGFDNQYPDPADYQQNPYLGMNPSNLYIDANGNAMYGGNTYGDRKNTYAGVWQQVPIPRVYKNEDYATGAQRDRAMEEWLQRWGRNGSATGNWNGVPEAPSYPSPGALVYEDPANMESARRHAGSLYGEGMPLGDPMQSFTDALAQQRIDAAKRAGMKQRGHWYGPAQNGQPTARGTAQIRRR